MKNYFMVLLSVMALGFMATPVTSLSPSYQVEDNQSIEAMYLPEIDKISKLSLEQISDTAEFTQVLEIGRTPSALPVTTTPVVAANYAATTADYQVSVYTNEIVAHPDYMNIYRTGKLIYAHNSSNLFGNLTSLVLGSRFTILENGVVTSYQVSDIKVFEKNPENGLLQLGGSGNYMEFLKDSAFYHSVALMTCTGTSYGNGDASHRLVVFADAV